MVAQALSHTLSVASANYTHESGPVSSKRNRFSRKKPPSGSQLKKTGKDFLEYYCKPLWAQMKDTATPILRLLSDDPCTNRNPEAGLLKKVPEPLQPALFSDITAATDAAGRVDWAGLRTKLPTWGLYTIEALRGVHRSKRARARCSLASPKSKQRRYIIT